MKIQVVTTLNKKLYNSYAKRFFETYNWPFDLTVYSEDMLDIPNYNTIVRSIYDEVPSCEEFVQRNKHRIALTDFKKKCEMLLCFVFFPISAYLTALEPV